MQIVFMGTPEFALPSLKTLLDRRYEVAAVVTAPDKPRGRGLEVRPTPVKDFSLQQGLPVLQPEKLSDPEFLSQLRTLQPDLIVVVAFRILPKKVFTLPKFGSFNLHASLLPKYRGAAPINWAIINGEQETGVTTFFLQEKVDTGSVILQARLRIGPDETAGELHDKLAEVGAEIVYQTVRLIEIGKAVPRLQDESLASPAPKIFKDDCQIDWKSPTQRLHN
ncbi:MAG: methionyl-tRNA formyltransferase, partial [Bacteroidota bacterium]